MDEYRYRVTTRAGEGEWRDRGSRFLAWVGPVAGEAQAAERLAAHSRRHSDATHHCWAWRLGQPPAERAVDAGEPAGTAGVPILRVLRGAGVSDTLAVVTRWYGGIKLGKGGLARAYAAAARAALDQCRFGERLRHEAVRLELPYAQLGALKRLVRPPEVELADATYGEVVRCTVRFLPPYRAEVIEALAALGLDPARGRERGH